MSRLLFSVLVLVLAGPSGIAGPKPFRLSISAPRPTLNLLPSPQSSAPRSATASEPPLGDYVPCLFDDSETYELRALEKPKLQKDIPLDASAAEAVAGLVKTIAVNLASPPVAPPQKGKKPEAPQPSRDQLNALAFANSLQADQFTNLLPEDVPAKVKSLAGGANVPAKIADMLVKLTETAVHSWIVGSTFDRPPDVSCSFSVLQWKETSDNFGRRVANDYIAIQVTVRNLNKQTEFLIHDIQIAVDTGLNRAQFGRFEAARDKLIVRNVAQRGQSEDRRNLIINTLQAAGAVAGGASTAVTQGLSGSPQAVDLSSAVAIFQGPFITGVVNIFPDHTLENINHINDLAFSASATSKTVVPILGSIPLVTFLSEKPLEQLPFAHCGSTTKKGFFHIGDSTKDAKDSDNAGSINYAFCKIDNDPATSDLASILQPAYYMKAQPFRKWDPAAIEVLQRRVFVVIGGVHIQELPNNPQVTKVTCPTLADGTVDLSAVDANGSIPCTLSGTQLNKAASIKLEQGTTVHTGTLKAASDGNSATIGFKATDFASAAGQYELFLTDSSGADLDTKQTLNFAVRKPDVTSVTYAPATLALVSTAAALVATITGTNLDRIATVTLNCCGTTAIKGTIRDTVKSGDKTMVVKFELADVTALIAKLAGPPVVSNAQLQYTTADNPKESVVATNSTIH